MLLCTFEYTPEQLCDITLDLLRREGWREDVYIRPLAYKDDDIIRLWLHDATDKLAIFSQPYGKYIAADAGAKVCVSSWRRVDDTAIPARGKTNGAYVNSTLIVLTLPLLLTAMMQPLHLIPQDATQKILPGHHEKQNVQMNGCLACRIRTFV